MSAPEIWLPLATAKSELRVHEANTDMDDVIGGQIVAAVSIIENDASVPLTDQTITVPACGKGTSPLYLGRISAPQDVVKVAYWTPGAGRGMPPDGDVQTADLGRFAADPYARGSSKVMCLYPPVAGWPAADRDEFLVDVSRGLRAADHPALRQAIILMVRHLFDGIMTGEKGKTALPASVRALVWPYSDLGDSR